MTSPDSGKLDTPGHDRQQFEPGVFDDTLDVHPPYQRYEGPVTPEALAAARKKAAELDLIIPEPLRRPAASRMSSTRNLAAARRRAK